MKHIILLILLLLLSLSTNVFAQEWKTYEAKDLYTVTIPKDWTTQIALNNLLISTSPDRSHNIGIVVGSSYKSLDDEIDSIQKMMFKSEISQFEEELRISNVNGEAVLLVYSNNNKGVKSYAFWCLSSSDQFIYIVWGLEQYEAFVTDRKTIDAILSSLKMLKHKEVFP